MTRLDDIRLDFSMWWNPSALLRPICILKGHDPSHSGKFCIRCNKGLKNK